MALQIIQNLYPVSWFSLTGHCYVSLMLVKRHLFLILFYFFSCFVVVVVVVCLFVCLLLLLVAVVLFLKKWCKLDCKSFVELCKFSNFK